MKIKGFKPLPDALQAISSFQDGSTPRKAQSSFEFHRHRSHEKKRKCIKKNLPFTSSLIENTLQSHNFQRLFCPDPIKFRARQFNV